MRENSVLAKSAKEAKAKGGFAGLTTQRTVGRRCDFVSHESALHNRTI